MWRRKSPDKIRRIEWWRNRYNLLPAALKALLLFLSSDLIFRSGLRAGGGTSDSFGSALILLGVSFPVIYLLQILGIRFGRRRPVICNQCFDVEARARGDQCQCGGIYEDFDHWEYVANTSQRGNEVNERP